MGYFDGLAAASFKTDGQGRTVYFPNGIKGKGYIIEDEARRAYTRNFLKYMYMVMLSLIIGAQILFDWQASAAVVVLFMLWWYLFAVKHLVKDLPQSDEKLTRAEAMRNSAKSHNMGTLVFLGIVSLGFTGIGLWAFMAERSPVMAACLAFFGMCTVLIGKMIIEKRRM